MQHEHDLSVYSTAQMGLKCCFITEVRNEDGTYTSTTCPNFAARYQAHCPLHSVAVSTQERQMYKGFASKQQNDNEFHIIKFGTKVQIKLPNLNQEGFRHIPFEIEYQSVHRSYHKLELAVRKFGRYYRQWAKDNNVEFDEQLFIESFDKPGRHQSWKAVYLRTKSMMEQLYLPMDDSWATLRIFLQKIGNAQGWAGKWDNATMRCPNDMKNSINILPIKPCEFRDKQREGYCYNDEVSPSGRLMFQSDGIEYHPRTKPAEQKQPMYYIEPDNFQSETEAKGVLVMGFASVILNQDHTLINTGKYITKF